MNHFKFFSAYLVTLLGLLWLSYVIFGLILQHPPLFSIFIAQCINTLGCYSLLGVGIGLPLLLLASILGWGQLVLLFYGDIDPHLSQEGFFKVLNTLLSKI